MSASMKSFGLRHDHVPNGQRDVVAMVQHREQIDPFDLPAAGRHVVLEYDHNANTQCRFHPYEVSLAMVSSTIRTPSSLKNRSHQRFDPIPQISRTPGPRTL